MCKCKDCGKTFFISKGEKEFYLSKKLELPKRCKECRILRRLKRMNKNTGMKYNSKSSFYYRPTSYYYYTGRNVFNSAFGPFVIFNGYR